MPRSRALAAPILALALTGLAPVFAPALTAPALASDRTTTAAPGLDLRAASQRRCLEQAQAQGFSVQHLARPTPIMGHRPGHVWGERVRMQVTSSAGQAQLMCTYEIGVMEAQLRRL